VGQGSGVGAPADASGGVRRRQREPAAINHGRSREAASRRLVGMTPSRRPQAHQTSEGVDQPSPNDRGRGACRRRAVRLERARQTHPERSEVVPPCSSTSGRGDAPLQVGRTGDEVRLGQMDDAHHRRPPARTVGLGARSSASNDPTPGSSRLRACE
jgi:hypothetical protein